MSTASSRTRIGVFGGTFDPIHLGHLIVASEALHALNLSQVIFVPAAMPWQKQTSESIEHRMQMAKLATACEPKFSVSDVDIVRGGNTYTVDTLTDLQNLHPSAELFLLLGTDALNNLHTWKNCEQISSQAHLVCLARPGFEDNSEQSAVSGVTFLTVPAIDISSTSCRDRVKYGRPFRYMVSESVFEYIEQHQLYRRVT